MKYIYLLIFLFGGCMANDLKKKTLTPDAYIKQITSYVENYEKTGMDVSSSGLEMICMGVKEEEGEKFKLCQRYFKARDARSEESGI